MAATNETKDFTVFVDGQPCLDIQNTNNTTPNDCYIDGQPFLTVFPDATTNTTRYFFGF